MIERPSLYPDWLEHLWAKSTEKGAGGEPESLAAHTWLVLLRFAELVRLRPTLPTELGREDLWHLLYWSLFLHDFGKAHPAFQGILRKDKNAKAIWGAHRHEVFSLPFLSWFVDGFREDQKLWLVAAIVSHHREPKELKELYPTFDENEEDDLDELIRQFPEQTLRSLWRWLDVCGSMWLGQLHLESVGVRPLQLVSQDQAVSQFLNDGASFVRNCLSRYQGWAKALGNEKEPSVLLTALTILRGSVIQSDHSASAHVNELQTLQIHPEAILQRCQLEPQKLYAHQDKAAQVKGSAMLIAPTGSGKTEAALLWAANQPKAARLFYTLPYQASMNAMKRRLSYLFGEFTVGLQHGRGLLALYRNLMEREYDPERAASTARWMRNLAELNYPPIRVFSPYQMLKAIYRLKGYEAQLVDYYQALFIMDEIHAYEVNRLAMILRMIQYLRENYQARFFVMSATFPTLIRQWICEALGDISVITAEPALYRQFQRHLVRCREGDLLDNLPIVINEAEAGKSVLVVCNTVARAQQAYQILSTHLPLSTQVLLIHGRFHQRDRMNKEKMIQDLFGKGSSNRKSVVLVSTQVVEVSLDIDLDVLFSDPAPLEALVQRFGRVNRSGRRGTQAEVNVYSEPSDGQRIYSSELIQRALCILRSHDGKVLDEDQINHWLDEVYADRVAEQWEKEYRKSVREFEAACLDTLRPFHTVNRIENQFHRLFDGIEVLPACLFEEYVQNLESEPITAEELLVPLRWGQYHMLANQGLIKAGDQRLPPVVMTPYTSELGLSFENPEYNEDWD
ncbi:MAG: CRISPR-associated helicase Cas3' [Anaerolineales bacterium]|nr:CRISPR-associated helicase Cas3' [Anaerolineales bacterium]